MSFIQSIFSFIIIIFQREDLSLGTYILLRIANMDKKCE